MNVLSSIFDQFVTICSYFSKKDDALVVSSIILNISSFCIIEYDIFAKRIDDKNSCEMIVSRENSKENWENEKRFFLSQFFECREIFLSSSLIVLLNLISSISTLSFYRSRCWSNKNRIWCRDLRLKIANTFENAKRKSIQRKISKTFELNDENFDLNELQSNFEIDIFAKTTWIVIDWKICWNKDLLLNVTSAIKIRDVKLLSEKILRLSN